MLSGVTPVCATVRKPFRYVESTFERLHPSLDHDLHTATSADSANSISPNTDPDEGETDDKLPDDYENVQSLHADYESLAERVLTPAPIYANLKESSAVFESSYKVVRFHFTECDEE